MRLNLLPAAVIDIHCHWRIIGGRVHPFQAEGCQGLAAAEDQWFDQAESLRDLGKGPADCMIHDVPAIVVNTFNCSISPG
jgi:hypothetical protein